MSTLVNYIKSGRGCGVRYLLLFALAVSVFIGVEIKMLGNALVPAAQDVADKILPLKFENGVIVEPDNVLKSFAIEADNQVVFPIIFDTTVDTIETSGLQPGIYISKKSLYAVGLHGTKTLDFSDITQSTLLSAGNYVDLFEMIATYVAVLTAIGIFFVIMAVYLLLVAFCALCSQFMTKMMKNAWNFVPLMRLNTLTFIASSLVLFVLGLCGLSSSFSVTIIATLLLDYIVIKNIDNTDKNKSKNKI